MSGNQYRATKIWHEIIESFQTNVPLKRHWRNFRAYSDCFAANEAIEWLYRYLKTSHNFKSQTSITRQQAIQLLQIFLKEKIIEDVRGEKYNAKEFQDDDRLFKFCSSDKYSIQYRKTEVKEQLEKKTEPIATHQHQHNPQLENDHQQTRRLSLTAKILRERNDMLPPLPLSLKVTTSKKLSTSDKTYQTKECSSNNYATASAGATSDTATPLLFKQQRNEDLSEIWSQSAISYLNETLKIDAQTSTSLFETIQICASNIQYNCMHVNKHGVVTNTNNKFEDLPAWVMQAMTTLVHWSDFKKDQNENQNSKSTAKAHPSFRDVYNEVNIYFYDHKEPLLTKQISKLFIRILRLFLQNTKQFDIDDFMKNLKEHLNSQTRHKDLNYIDNDVIDAMNCGSENNCCAGSQNGSDMCCTQCQSTLDFVNNWLNCNEVEFNEFVMNLNSNYRGSSEQHETANKKFKIDSSVTMTSEDYSTTLVNENERKKLRRNNSFITAVNATTDSNNSSNSSCSTNNNSTVLTNNKNLQSSLNQMFKTHSLDQISEAFNKSSDASMAKDDLLMQKSSSCQKSFNDTQKIRNMLVNSISLNNIAQMQHMPSKCSQFSVGALSSLISSVSLKDVNNGDSLTLGFEYDTFKHIIRAFRICSLFLPPINKRKLHLLLRLLYKLKFSEHAKLLLCNEYEELDYEMEYDTSSIESILINSFLKSIISFDTADENLAIRIVHVLINNYSDIMRVPEDFLATVNETINSKKSNFCSKISVEQYEFEKNESKQHLIKLLYNILTNITMTQEDKIKRLKQFKDFYPEIYEEKHATIKKAINVLGINETSSRPRGYQVAKKRSLNATTIMNIDDNDENMATTPASHKYHGPKVNKNSNLDSTNIFQNLNIMQSSAISFPKFSLPKTLKKVKL